MAKPRVIIADTDKSYILSIQLAVVEAFFGKIELEIITDEMYFDSLFSVPQKADILIISEELYDISLQKHNVPHIFVLKETQENNQTAALNVNTIYKYTGTKEILNEIIGKSQDIFEIDGENKKEPQIIVVTSASGGVGKTTVAMGICASLTKNFKKVLYINAEYLQTFQCLLKNSTAISGSDIYSSLSHKNERMYQDVKHLIRKEAFHYFPPLKTSLMSIGISISAFERLALSAKKTEEYDFIVVDTDSIFDDNKVDLLNIADKVVFVTRQNKMSVFATNMLVTNINGVNSEKYIYVCNDFDKNKDNAIISPEYTMQFTVNEYIEHVSNYEQLRCSDFINYSTFQKIGYLFL